MVREIDIIFTQGWSFVEGGMSFFEDTRQERLEEARQKYPGCTFEEVELTAGGWHIICKDVLFQKYRARDSNSVDYDHAKRALKLAMSDVEYYSKKIKTLEKNLQELDEEIKHAKNI